MTSTRGIGGTLLPERYIADRLMPDTAAWHARSAGDHARRRFDAWWSHVVASCGPASGLRALFDLVAMPLFGLLGFRAHDADFVGRELARARLETRARAPLALVLVPWAARPPGRWRDVITAARKIGASWGMLLAPPFLSIVDARGHAMRRSLEFVLPDAWSPVSFERFWQLASAESFDVAADAGGLVRIEHVVMLAAQFQDHVRRDLQHGVVEALDALSAAIGRPAHMPQSGTATATTPEFEEALTLVYRILFLLFAESRDLVPHRDPVYGRAYAIGAFCREALRAGSRPGLWDGLAAVTRLSRSGCRTRDLIVRPFNGRLFARAAAPTLEAGRPTARATRRTTARDAALQRALVALGSRPGRAGREAITFADLGVEQLGAVYERVLDLDPASEPVSLEPGAAARRRPAARSRHSHSVRRKQSGTFYTPQPLAEFLVRRTLAPLVAGASADAILSLRVVDPAMGSGAFLVAACRYLAAAYERALVDEGRAGAADFDEDERADIRRQVAERCLAGVDRNPIAVQLARLSLWLTTLARGKPLGFLDHRLRTGNSLVGTTPEDLWRVDGKRHERTGLPLLDAAGVGAAVQATLRPLHELGARRDDTVEDVRVKEELWRQLASSRSPLHRWRQALSAWCARWFWPPDGPAAPSSHELRALLDAILKGDRTLPADRRERWLRISNEVADAHAFFHWPLEFPDVFYDDTGQSRREPGFDAVVGNPPWEMLREERTDDDAATGAAAARARLSSTKSLVRFIRDSGHYTSCDRGHVNLYQPFVARALALTRRGGRIGLILPWGLAADDGAAVLRRELLDHASIETLVGLDNSGGLFPIHRGLRFLAIVVSPGRATMAIRARCGVKSAHELDALPERDDSPDRSAFPLRLTPPMLRAIGGPALRFPDLRRTRDLDLLERIARRFPPLGDAAGWGARFGRELNATDDRSSFGPHGLPIVEGKHLTPFAVDLSHPASFIGATEAGRRLPDRRFEHPRLGYRDVSGVANRLSLIAAIVPSGVVTTHTVFCLRSAIPLDAQYFLCGLFNSYVLNAVVRLLMGGHLTTSLIEGLPVPPWREGAREQRVARLARRCSSRANSRQTHAQLQGEVARLYEIDASEFRHVLDGFPLVSPDERDRAARAFAGRVGRDANDTFAAGDR